MFLSEDTIKTLMMYLLLAGMLVMIVVLVRLCVRDYNKAKEEADIHRQTEEARVIREEKSQPGYQALRDGDYETAKEIFWELQRVPYIGDEPLILYHYALSRLYAEEENWSRAKDAMGSSWSYYDGEFAEEMAEHMAYVREEYDKEQERWYQILRERAEQKEAYKRERARKNVEAQKRASSYAYEPEIDYDDLYEEFLEEYGEDW